MFFVVRNQIGERESVVRGHKVDGRPRFPPALIKKVSGSAQPRGQRRRKRAAFPEFAHRIAKFIVPFRPTRWKLAYLISTRPEIPRLSDQLDASEHWILAAGFQETTLRVE